MASHRRSRRNREKRRALQKEKNRPSSHAEGDPEYESHMLEKKNKK